MRVERTAKGTFSALVFRDDGEDSLLEAVPDRGGILTRWRVRGFDALYLDEATLLDPSASVRGGIPVLFPVAGRLPGDAATFDGRPIATAQHGFARKLPWTVYETGERLVLGLRSNESTRAAFPFDFELRVAYRLLGASLSVESTLVNAGDWDLPVHLGFHPYFRVPASVKSMTRIEAAAFRALDRRTGSVGTYGAPPLGGDEVDLEILDPRGGAVRIVAPGQPSIRLDYGGFPVVVVWTLPGRDFVCIEPWSAPAGALARGGARRLRPGETDSRTWFVQVEM